MNFFTDLAFFQASLTQAVATILALTGFLMPAAVSWPFVAFIWLWSFFFMQLTEVVKIFGKQKL